MAPIFLSAFIVLAHLAIKSFDLVIALTGGGPGFATDLPLKALAGVVLVIGYVIYVRATMRSIGVFGVGLIAALFAALAWVLFDYGVLDVQTPGILQWLVPIAAGLIMGIGLSWSHVRRSITGQGDVDDVDE